MPKTEETVNIYLHGRVEVQCQATKCKFAEEGSNAMRWLQEHCEEKGHTGKAIFTQVFECRQIPIELEEEEDEENYDNGS